MAMTAKQVVEDPMLAITEKFKNIATWRGSRSLEHSSAIRMTHIGVATGRPVFLLGTKGAAKSQLARDLSYCLEGAEFHEDQMHAEKSVRDLTTVFTDLGRLVKSNEYGYQPMIGSPVHEMTADERAVLKEIVTWSVKNPGKPLPPELEKRRHRCPDWGIRLIDETFCGSQTSLNALNSLLNEGYIRMAAQLFHTNFAVIGTGNAIRDFASASTSDVTLQTGAALWSRFLLREKVRPFVRAQDARNSMHVMAVDQAREIVPPVQITRAEMEMYRRNLRLMVTAEKHGGTADATYPKHVRRLVDKFVDAARKNGIPLDDRRWPWAREALAANALLDGRLVIGPQDVKTARWWGWESPNQISTVLEILQDLVEMGEKKRVDEETACGKIYQELLDSAKSDPALLTDPAKAAVRITRGNQVSSQLSDSCRKLNDLARKFPDEADDILATADQVRQWNRDVLRRFVGQAGLDD